MPDTSHPYYKGIETALLADTTEPTAATLADNRLYPDQLPNDPELPGVRYAMLTDLPHHRLASGDSVTADVQVDVYAKRGDEKLAWTVDQYVRRALDRKNLTVTGFERMHCMCMDRGKPFREHGYYRITSRYRLFGSAA